MASEINLADFYSDFVLIFECSNAIVATTLQQILQKLSAFVDAGINLRILFSDPFSDLHFYAHAQTKTDHISDLLFSDRTKTTTSFLRISIISTLKVGVQGAAAP